MRQSCLLGIALLLAGTSACGSGAPSSPAAGGAAFDRFWQDFDRTYPYFDAKQVDWSADRARLRERAAATTSITALIDVLRETVAPLRDVHARFRGPGGAFIPSYVPTRAPNWDPVTWQQAVAGLGLHQGTGWFWGREGDVGYLVVSAWDSTRIHITDLDAALDQLRDTRALVIDVRMNGGGDDALALQLAGRFATSPVRFGAVRYRNGPQHSDFTAWTDRVLSPRGPWQYTQPVWLLVGAGCFSSTETFVSAMQELPGITVAGDTSGGGSGNPKDVSLVLDGRDTGWVYTVPTWMEVTADGTMIEWNGIAPAVSVPVETGRDAVLAWALAR